MALELNDKNEYIVVEEFGKNINITKAPTQSERIEALEGAVTELAEVVVNG